MERKSKEKLIADLQALAAKLGRSLTVSDVNAAKGIASVSTYTKFFGSFNQAREAAGLATRKRGEK